MRGPRTPDRSKACAMPLKKPCSRSLILILLPPAAPKLPLHQRAEELCRLPEDAQQGGEAGIVVWGRTWGWGWGWHCCGIRAGKRPDCQGARRSKMRGMNCPHCGYALSTSDRFCPQCATPVVAPSGFAAPRPATKPSYGQRVSEHYSENLSPRGWTAASKVWNDWADELEHREPPSAPWKIWMLRRAVLIVMVSLLAMFILMALCRFVFFAADYPPY